MEDQGILRRIRELLIGGATTTHVIGKGYAPGSVYKANRQLRRIQEGSIRTSIVPVPWVSALVDGADSAGELAALQQRIEGVRSRIEAQSGTAP